MSMATVTVRLQPRRLMTKAEAAHYCRRTVKKFVAQCPVRPLQMADGDELYDVQDLDAWIEGLKDGGNYSDDLVGRLE
jgi:hypothetical protein